MPTTPAQQPHQARKMAESFGVDSERYDRTRPPYPQAMVDRVLAASPGRDLLDVGSGTGIAARQFQQAGCTVLAVEPDERMAAFARRTGVETEVARFEEWDAAGRTFDAAVAATAWHWIDPDKGAAKAAEVLRPHGLLAACWHVFQTPPSLMRAHNDALKRVLPDSPFAGRPATMSAMDGYRPMFTSAADGIRRSGRFGEPEEWTFAWERVYTRDEWLDQLPTSGVLTQLAPDQLQEVLAAAGAAVDAIGGSFTMSYTTVVVAAVRAA
ncbi:class I SAM-dependent methyltransferase [[Actinomadura] parvosata]|uniref:class I SAM-dependent methyltransferase n=1 Tax=[Actinomadura] parvosata TaxID=1955412 RepID=UPI00406C0CD1